ncbi:efflux transporter outer membrane subunit [Altererythrobacter arenosus]|uniref:Efflux transporter outer membrane subunit n=1 Tax=Altererythrobacter arenosus TaxID=3032592 RepID=A0ABY8FLU3_9SPHN|nr:efflux transporter outer membrane subunit [Altererythrobacter sp. CAU 1644]WFL75984.1 efflux transporter outer membrane subunit [Altererythrobacter sp. CAU 1644]
MRLRNSLVLIPAVALGACVAGPAPEIATPVPTLPGAFFYVPATTESAALEALLPSSDPAFVALSDQALSDSPTLGEALARVEAARAGAARAGAERLPSVGADASVTGTRTNPNQFGNSLPPGISIDTERTSYAANLTARWDPDLFGVLKASERAALARIDAASAGAQAVRLALISEIAASVIDWRTLSSRREALEQDVAAATRLADLARQREEAGIAPGFDRVRAQATASQSRSRMAALASEEARLIGRLVTLTARDAAWVAAALETPAPDRFDTTAPAALPSLLLANRPDVARAEAELAASDAELAAAARKRFPRLTLSAALGLLAFDLGELFDSDSVVGSAGGSLLAPLLDFGRIQAEIDGAAAEKQAAFARYRGAVFAALGDAETAYGLVAAADAEAAAAADEFAQLQRAAALADTRYRAGLADFLTVLEARRAADASGERAAASLGRAQRARVLLWQALGGDVQPTSRSISQ